MTNKELQAQLKLLPDDAEIYNHYDRGISAASELSLSYGRNNTPLHSMWATWDLYNWVPPAEKLNAEQQKSIKIR